MGKMTKEQRRRLKRINWDYDIPVEDIFSVINGEKEYAGHWNLDALLVRMLERLSWYDLLDFLGPDLLAGKLTNQLLCKIRNKEKRIKYERLGKILRGEPVSFTKWGAKYRAESKDTLFSNRWYSS